MEEDSYKTIAATAEASFRERSSRFLGLAYHVGSPDEVKTIVDGLRKEYYDATHHCYAYRLGAKGEVFRANDDGEPSGTAGKPILGQLLSKEVTDCLVVVVRWFGGTKLGVAGLIAAYRQAAADVLSAAEVVERQVERRFVVQFPYEAVNAVMKIVKELAPRVEIQRFDTVCSMELAIRAMSAERLESALRNVGGAQIEEK